MNAQTIAKNQAILDYFSKLENIKIDSNEAYRLAKVLKVRLKAIYGLK